MNSSTHTPSSRQELSSLGSELERLQSEYHTLQGELRSAERDLRTLESRLTGLQSRISSLEMAAAVLQDASARWKLETSGWVDQLVSAALTEVFETEYTFVTEWKLRRGKVEAEFKVRSGGPSAPLLDITTSRGGGIRDIAAFALRVVTWWMTDPRPTGVLILDEPFRFVSASYQSIDQVRELLMSVCRQFGVQIVLITHETALQVGTVYEVRDGEISTRD